MESKMDIIEHGEVKATYLQGWSAGYNEGLKTAYKYIYAYGNYIDADILDNLKSTFEILGGDIDEKK